MKLIRFSCHIVCFVVYLDVVSCSIYFSLFFVDTCKMFHFMYFSFSVLPQFIISTCFHAGELDGVSVAALREEKRTLSAAMHTFKNVLQRLNSQNEQVFYACFNKKF